MHCSYLNRRLRIVIFQFSSLSPVFHLHRQVPYPSKLRKHMGAVYVSLVRSVTQGHSSATRSAIAIVCSQHPKLRSYVDARSTIAWSRVNNQAPSHHCSNKVGTFEICVSPAPGPMKRVAWHVWLMRSRHIHTAGGSRLSCLVCTCLPRSERRKKLFGTFYLSFHLEPTPLTNVFDMFRKCVFTTHGLLADAVWNVHFCRTAMI